MRWVGSSRPWPCRWRPPIPRSASACCASRARLCGRWGAEPSKPRSWPRRRRAPARSAIPCLLSQALRLRVLQEIEAEGQDAADALADEALGLATAAGDDWEIAEASRGKAIAASSIAELRERVDRAATLLSDVGNVHELANTLTDAAYAALCLGSDSRRSGLRRPRDADHARARQSVRNHDQQRQPRPRRAAARRRPTPPRVRSERSSRTVATWSSDPWCSRACAAWRRSPRWTATPSARQRSSAPPTRTATPRLRTRSRTGSTRRSSSPPAHGAGPRHGMPRRARAAA